MVLGELLSTAVVFPLWFPTIFILATIGLSWLTIRNWQQNRRWNPEGKLFIKARKEGYRVLEIHALNGFFKWVLGEKQKKGDPIFKKDAETNEGIHFDPSLQSGSVPISRTIGGLEIIRYATNSPTAMGVRNAIAQDVILNHVRAYHPDLNIFPDPMIIEMVGCTRADLPHDCNNLARDYDVDIRPSDVQMNNLRTQATQELMELHTQQGLPAPTEEDIDKRYEELRPEYITQYRTTWLVKKFMQIQDEVALLPLETGMRPMAVELVENVSTKLKGLARKVSYETRVHTGRFFSFAEAFQNNASAFTAVDIQTFMQLFEKIGLLKAENKWDKYIPLLVGAGIFVVLVAVGLTIMGAKQ